MKIKKLKHIMANDVHFYSGYEQFNLKAAAINILFNPSLQLVLLHRAGNYCYRNDHYIIAMAIEWLQNILYGCLIANQAEIGSNFRIAHPLGIVIGVSRIEENVTIWHNVTIGSHGKKNVGKSFPTVKSGVKIFPNSVIIGGVNIGENATIGALSFINRDIPANATVIKYNQIL